MGVERIANRQRQIIVDDHVACRRQPESDDVMDVETMEAGAVNAADRVRKNEAAEDEIHRRPDEGADEIPERDIERRLQAAPDGDEKLRGRCCTDDENRNFGIKRKLARFEAMIEAQSQADDACHKAEI